jgi:hypothetical protein
MRDRSCFILTDLLSSIVVHNVAELGRLDVRPTSSESKDTFTDRRAPLCVFNDDDDDDLVRPKRRCSSRLVFIRARSMSTNVSYCTVRVPSIDRTATADSFTNGKQVAQQMFTLVNRKRRHAIAMPTCQTSVLTFCHRRFSIVYLSCATMIRIGVYGCPMRLSQNVLSCS